MKIREFAKQEGVSPQAVYKLLKTHEEALNGHVLKVKKGMELDAYAINYLQEKMVGKNIVVADRSHLEEIEHLKAEVKALQDELLMKNQRLLDSQNEILQIRSNIEDDIKAAEDKLKLDLESKHCEAENKLKTHYQEEIKRLTTELNFEKQRKWKFPWSK